MFHDRLHPEESEIGVQIALFKKRLGLSPDHRLPEDTVKVLRRIRSDNPAIRPVVEEIPTEIQINKWKSDFVQLFINKETATRVADTLVNSIQRIDESQFEQSLMASYALAARKIRKEDLSKTNFIYYSGRRRRSNEWVREIAKDYLPDDTILDLPLLDYSDENVKKSCNTGIIMDDASYSGVQITDHMRVGHERFGMKRFYVIVPFMTERAITKIVATARQLGVKIEMFVQKKMPTSKEILGANDYQWLVNQSPSSRCTDEQTTTYFAHKIPDYRSFCPYLGNTRYVQVESHLDSLFIQGPAVYHNDYLADLRKRGLIT